MKKPAIIAALLATTGCASITRGVNENVVINYAPADAEVRTSMNHQCSATPCTVSVPRKTPFQITASKPGYQTQIVDVKTKLAGRGAAGFAGNIVAGGIVGMGVDAATGATLNHDPNPVNITLVPVDEVGSTLPPVPETKPTADEAAPAQVG